MMTRNLRANVGLMAVAALMILLAVNLSGCSDDDSPTAAPVAKAPTLPDPGQLTFDFAFFDGAATLEQTDKARAGEHDNFLNAYLRVVILDALADLTLAGPVGAFALALHAVPEAQDDGAWIWRYTWEDYRFPINLALRGLPAGDHVDWEMRVGAGDAPAEALWFRGATNGDGSEGRWTFYDLDDAAAPVTGEIAWGRALAGRYLEFVSHEDGSDGDALRFTDADPSFRVDFTPGDGSRAWFIQWQADGTGSLQVPDYNGGLEACWDRWQENVDCF
jgi:hypothetical protein